MLIDSARIAASPWSNVENQIPHQKGIQENDF